MFWISAVLGGSPAAIEALHDGWHSTPKTGLDAVSIYQNQITSSDKTLAGVDLDAPSPLVASSHAGHLDIVRELIDGHQNLVVN